MADDSVVYVYHPHELALKGKNRKRFESDLTNCLRNQMRDNNVPNVKIEQIHGRHFLTAPLEKEQLVEEVSPRVFGVANYARCYVIKRDYDLLKESILEYVKKINEIKPIPSFKVETSRVDKRFEISSNDVSRQVGSVIHETLGIPAKMVHPDFTIRIEILNDKFMYFSDKKPGALGLPIPSSGRFMCLLSGGFDSPVAAWMMMRRGCAIQFVHFHSQPYGEWHSSIGKVKKIAAQLAKWGGPKKFYAIPIGEQQRQIAVKAPPKLRITLYRRLMMRVAKELAQKQFCSGLATGDSLGQVASQTIESMTTIQATVSPMLIMRPLLGFAKEEIMARAEKIGTHDLSLLPGGDCCSHMLPKKVATKPTPEEAEAAEKNLDIEEMVSTAIASAQLIGIDDHWNEEDADVGAACPLEFHE